MSACTFTYTSSLCKRAQFRSKQLGCSADCRKAKCWCSWEIRLEHRGDHSFWEAIQQCRYGEQMMFVPLAVDKLGVCNTHHQCVGYMDYGGSQDWISGIKKGETYKAYFIGATKGRIVTTVFIEAFRFALESVQTDCRLAHYDPYEKRFPLKVVGVTYENPDGTNRQEIIAKCRAGEPLNLVREPKNPKHERAIAVYRRSGEQIGYIPFDVAEYELSCHMNDPLQQVSARVIEVKGGPSLESDFNYGCVIEITIRSPKPDPQDIQTSYALTDAAKLEILEPNKSIVLFKSGIKSLGNKAHPYTINRMTSLLERLDRNKECIEAIDEFERIANLDDLTKSQKQIMETIRRRKDRIVRLKERMAHTPVVFDFEWVEEDCRSKKPSKKTGKQCKKK